MVITYYFDENGDGFDYEVDDLYSKLASILADELNAFRKEQAEKRHIPFKKISDEDMYDALDWVDAFDDIDPSDYASELEDICEDEAYVAWKERYDDLY